MGFAHRVSRHCRAFAGPENCSPSHCFKHTTFAINCDHCPKTYPKIMDQWIFAISGFGSPSACRLTHFTRGSRIAQCPASSLLIRSFWVRLTIGVSFDTLHSWLENHRPVDWQLSLGHDTATLHTSHPCRLCCITGLALGIVSASSNAFLVGRLSYPSSGWSVLLTNSTCEGAMCAFGGPHMLLFERTSC